MAASLGLSAVILDPNGIGGRVRSIAWIDNLLGQRSGGPELVARWEDHVAAAAIPVVADRAVTIDAVDGRWSISSAGGYVVSGAGAVAAVGTCNRQMANHRLIEEVANGYSDVFFDREIHDRLLVEEDVVVIGCDRPLVTFARSVGDARPHGHLRVVALPEKRNVLDTWPDDWPLDVVKASVVRFVGPHRVEVASDDGVIMDMDASLVVTNLGGTPNSELFARVLDRDTNGYLSPEPRHQESPPLYAAGDVVNPDEQRVSIAIGTGAGAALNCFRRLPPRPFPPRRQ
jgi:thioredoxin reductase